jgi:hypothetical protein
MDKMERIVKILQEPTPSEHVRFLPKGMKNQNDVHSALAIPYVDIAFVRQRLDDACGPFGWQLEAKEINGLSFAGIGIQNPDTDEWVWRWDTGQDEPWNVDAVENLRAEGEKYSMAARGIFSISIKRAAYNWGIGRDVNAMRCFRCECKVWGPQNKFSSWKENPLVRQVEHARNRQALPPASTETLNGIKEVVEGGAERTKFADDAAKRIHAQCMEAAKFSCGMEKSEYDPIFEEFENERGCTTEGYMDLFNLLQDYRKAKLYLAQSNEDVTHGEILAEIRSVNPA